MHASVLCAIVSCSGQTVRLQTKPTAQVGCSAPCSHAVGLSPRLIAPLGLGPHTPCLRSLQLQHAARRCLASGRCLAMLRLGGGGIQDAHPQEVSLQQVAQLCATLGCAAAQQGKENGTGESRQPTALELEQMLRFWVQQQSQQHGQQQQQPGQQLALQQQQEPAQLAEIIIACEALGVPWDALLEDACACITGPALPSLCARQLMQLALACFARCAAAPVSSALLTHLAAPGDPVLPATHALPLLQQLLACRRRLPHPDKQRALAAKCAAALVQAVEALTPGQVAVLLCALGVLEVRCLGRETLRALAERFGQGLREARAPSISRALVGLARLGWRPSLLLNQVVHHLNSHPPLLQQFTTRDLVHLLWSLACLRASGPATLNLIKTVSILLLLAHTAPPPAPTAPGALAALELPPPPRAPRLLPRFRSAEAATGGGASGTFMAWQSIAAQFANSVVTAAASMARGGVGQGSKGSASAAAPAANGSSSGGSVPPTSPGADVGQAGARGDQPQPPPGVPGPNSVAAPGTANPPSPPPVTSPIPSPPPPVSPTPATPPALQSAPPTPSATATGAAGNRDGKAARQPLSVKELSVVTWACVRCGYSNKTLISQLLRLLMAAAPAASAPSAPLPPMVAAQAAWACGHLQYWQEGLDAWMEAHLAGPMRQPGGVGCQNVAMLAWGMAACGRRPSARLTASILAAATEVVGEFKAGELSALMWALASWGVQLPPALVEGVVEHVGRRGGGYSTWNLCSVVMALDRVLPSVPHSLLASVEQHLLPHVHPCHYPALSWYLFTCQHHAHRPATLLPHLARTASDHLTHAADKGLEDLARHLSRGSAGPKQGSWGGLDVQRWPSCVAAVVFGLGCHAGWTRREEESRRVVAQLMAQAEREALKRPALLPPGALAGLLWGMSEAQHTPREWLSRGLHRTAHSAVAAMSFKELSLLLQALSRWHQRGALSSAKAAHVQAAAIRRLLLLVEGVGEARPRRPLGPTLPQWQPVLPPWQQGQLGGAASGLADSRAPMPAQVDPASPPAEVDTAAASSSLIPLGSTASSSGSEWAASPWAGGPKPHVLVDIVAAMAHMPCYSSRLLNAITAKALDCLPAFNGRVLTALLAAFATQRHDEPRLLRAVAAAYLQHPAWQPLTLAAVQRLLAAYATLNHEPGEHVLGAAYRAVQRLQVAPRLLRMANAAATPAAADGPGLGTGTGMAPEEGSWVAVGAAGSGVGGAAVGRAVQGVTRTVASGGSGNGNGSIQPVVGAGANGAALEPAAQYSGAVAAAASSNAVQGAVVGRGEVHPRAAAPGSSGSAWNGEDERGWEVVWPVRGVSGQAAAVSTPGLVNVERAGQTWNAAQQSSGAESEREDDTVFSNVDLGDDGLLDWDRSAVSSSSKAQGTTIDSGLVQPAPATSSTQPSSSPGAGAATTPQQPLDRQELSLVCMLLYYLALMRQHSCQLSRHLAPPLAAALESDPQLLEAHGRQVGACLALAQADGEESVFQGLGPASRQRCLDLWSAQLRRRVRPGGSYALIRDVCRVLQSLGLSTQASHLSSDGLASFDISSQLGDRRLALELLRPATNCCRNTLRLTGEASMRRRLQQARGYQVLYLSGRVWEELGTNWEGKVRLVKKLLLQEPGSMHLGAFDRVLAPQRREEPPPQVLRPGSSGQGAPGQVQEQAGVSPGVPVLYPPPSVSGAAARLLRLPGGGSDGDGTRRARARGHPAGVAASCSATFGPILPASGGWHSGGRW